MSVLVTTAAKVLEILGSSSLPANTAVIESMISGVSAEFERALDRYLLATSRTAQLDARADQRLWSLRGYPVSAITTVKFHQLRDFSAATALTSTRYWIGTDTDDHLLEIDGPDAVGRGVLQVVYTGGMAATTAAFLAAYPDIALAGAMEVAHRWQRRDTQSVLSVASGADAQGLAPLDFTRRTLDVISTHRRWTA